MKTEVNFRFGRRQKSKKYVLCNPKLQFEYEDFFEEKKNLKSVKEKEKW